MKAKARAPRARRPAVLHVAVRFPAIGRAALLVLLRLPQGRLRRAIGEWGMREVGVGSVARRDYDAIRALAAPDFKVVPAPPLATLLGVDAVLFGVDAGIGFLQAWFDAWGVFNFVPQEGVDLGDGRVLVLNYLNARGAASGVEIRRQEEAELWESRGGLVVGVQQWWTWREALEAIGLSE